MSDRELLARIDERVENVEERMNGMAPRVRALEVKTWMALGAVGILGFLIKLSDFKIFISKPVVPMAEVHGSER